jgi:hypothetical protein
MFKETQSTFSLFLYHSRQVGKDCELLEQERIMDYSLLVGIHFKGRCKDNDEDDPEERYAFLPLITVC